MAERAIEVRELSGAAEMAAASQLWDRIWVRPEPGHEIDPALMVALAHAGSYLAGAFDSGRLVGAALGFWGSPDYAALHSHITGVLPSHAGVGIGTMIKNHQRTWCLDRGCDAITWTYDPLVSRNAHLNLNRLGARPERYLPDLYGDLGDDLNRGDPSDRLLVRWVLTADPPPATDAPAAALLTAYEGAPVVGARLQDLDVARALSIAVPDDVAALRRRDPALASLWRMAVREALAPLLERGWRVTGFDRTDGYRVEAPPS